MIYLQNSVVVTTQTYHCEVFRALAKVDDSGFFYSAIVYELAIYNFVFKNIIDVGHNVLAHSSGDQTIWNIITIFIYSANGGIFINLVLIIQLNIEGRITHALGVTTNLLDILELGNSQVIGTRFQCREINSETFTEVDITSEVDLLVSNDLQVVVQR